jgi:hypothetical protein
MLGGCVASVAFTLLNAGKRADEWQPPSLPKVETVLAWARAGSPQFGEVETVLAWARVHRDLKTVQQAVDEYEHAFGREMILAGEQEREQDGTTWALPCYAWRNAS